MVAKRLLQHASDSISASKLVTLVCPVYQTISQLLLTFTNSGAAATAANIKSGVSKITVLVNGEQVVNISATDLYNAYAMMGQEVYANATSNSLPLMLGGLLMKLPETESLITDIGCDKWADGAPVTNIQVQVQFASSVTGLTDVQLYSERLDKGTGLNITRAVCKLLTYSQTASSTGIFELDSLPRDARIGRIFSLCTQGTAVFSTGEALVNSDPVYQQADLNTINAMLGARGYTQPSGTLAFVFSDGSMANSLLSMQGVDDFRLKLGIGTAGTFNVCDCTVRAV